MNRGQGHKEMGGTNFSIYGRCLASNSNTSKSPASFFKGTDEKRKAPSPIETLFPDSVSQVKTPLKSDKWTLELSAHPDRLFVEYILHGIKYGFRIGFNKAQQLHPTSNRSSSYDHAELIKQHLDREVELERMYKCLYGSKPSCVHTSPIGIIPKKNKPNK